MPKLNRLEAHKQVELILPDGLRTVTWLPSSGLREGAKVEGAEVCKVYNLILYPCSKCQRLCYEDVTSCLCD